MRSSFSVGGCYTRHGGQSDQQTACPVHRDTRCDVPKPRVDSAVIRKKIPKKNKRMTVRNGRGERVLALIHQPECSNKVQGEARRATHSMRRAPKKKSDKTVKCRNTTAKMADEARDRPKYSECDPTSLTPAFSTSPSSSGGWHNKRGRM